MFSALRRQPSRHFDDHAHSRHSAVPPGLVGMVSCCLQQLQLTLINLFIAVACALRTTLSISAPVKLRVLLASSGRSTAWSSFSNFFIWAVWIWNISTRPFSSGRPVYFVKSWYTFEYVNEREYTVHSGFSQHWLKVAGTNHHSSNIILTPQTESMICQIAPFDEKKRKN